MFIFWCLYICSLFVWPLINLIIKGLNCPWSLALTPLAISSYGLSVSLATIATLLNLFFGSLMAWTFVRYEFYGKRWFQRLVEIPLVLPASLIGMILVDLYGPKGWIGRYLTLSYSPAGMCLAMMTVSLPLVVRTMQPVIAQLEKDMEEAAWCLGASSWQTFRYAIWPNLVPTIITCLGLTWSRCVGEFGALMIISRNLPYKDLATSVLIASLIEQDDEASATIIALMMMLLCGIVLAFLEYSHDCLD